MKKTIITYSRMIMTRIAIVLDRLFNGKLKPSHITTISLLGHIPVAWSLITCRPITAALLLAFFSALDALDGALARVQNSSSLAGMYYDAVSDRIKEVIVFSALAVFATKHIDTSIAWQVVAAAGTSLIVSYTKAKGEMAISDSRLDKQQLNRVFGSGLASYEIRVIALVIGLLFGLIEFVLPLLIIANVVTIISRFTRVSNELRIIDNQSLKKEAKKK
jgi:phosphatidylglycerophosphate synthase